MSLTDTQKYQAKAKDSFTTKKRMFIFDKALKQEKECNLQEFEQFKITKRLVADYTTKYWQYNRDKKVRNGYTPDELYHFMKKFEEDNNDKLKDFEKDYVNNFEKVFKKDDFELLLKQKHCKYCKITETEIKALADKHQLFKKSERGWSLEVDRKNSNYEYTKDNCVMACYWCNNAKTDEFTHEEFMLVGTAIEYIWIKRLSKG